MGGLIAANTGVVYAQQRLIVSGSELVDEHAILSDVGIGDGTFVFLQMRPYGPLGPE